MKKSKLFVRVAITSLMVWCFAFQPLFACTVLLVGKDATVDGSTMCTHNDDSSGADFRLWLIPGGTWPEGSKRDLVLDSHNYGDYGNYPAVKDYGNGYLVEEIPQAKVTYPYLHSRYSFINAKGVAMGETTMSIDTSTEYGKKVNDLLFKDNNGLIDCWNAQDIALERATTAREAVKIMGDLVEKYGWKDPGETIDICDGNEAWVAEYYGKDLWCAVRIPDNAFFVAANRARIDHVDFNDQEHYLYSPNLKSFAIEHGLWAEANGKDFSPAEVYAPTNTTYSTRREWRAFDLVAPSLHLDPNAKRFPLWVIPERKLSVQDLFEISGDYYGGSAYDISKQPIAGPYGDVLSPQNSERTINLFRTCYVMIANIKNWLPDEAKCLVWYGYGAADTTYITPLFPSMTELPELYRIGNRYQEFNRDSGWWTNSYVQQVARINYRSASKDIHDFRQPRMNAVYDATNEIQTVAARLIRQGKKDSAVNLLTTYAYTTAEDWHNRWLKLGDELLGTYMWGNKKMKAQGYSDWWKGVLKNAPADK